MKSYQKQTSGAQNPGAIKRRSARHRKLRLAVLPLSGLLLGQAARSASGALYTWTGAANNAAWNTNGDWSPNTNFPGQIGGVSNADTAVFNAALPNTVGTSGNPIILPGSFDILNINFDTSAGNYFIGGNTDYNAAGGQIAILSTLTSTNAIETINAPINIRNGGATFSLLNNSANGTGAGAGTLNVSGQISDGGGTTDTLNLGGSNTNANTVSGNLVNGDFQLAVTKNGAGTWVLSGANSYTGGTALNGGTLALGASGALGTTGTISFGGGTLQYSSSNTTDYSSRFSTASQPMKIDTNGQSVTFATALMGSTAGSLTKLGSGTLTLTAASNFTGGTTISGGNLTIGNAAALSTSSGTINFTGGTLQYGSGITTDYSGRFATTTGQSFSVDTNGNNVAFGTAIQGAGNTFTKLGAGTLTMSAANSYSGGTTINAGTLALGASGSLGSGNVTVNSSATLSVLPSTLGSNLTLAGGTVQTGYSSDNSGSGGAITITGGNVVHTFLSSGTLTVSGTVTASGVVVGGGGGGDAGVTSSVYGTGGGGGQVSLFSGNISSSTSVTVGGGGAAGSGSNNNGGNGGSSSIGTITLASGSASANGGGGGVAAGGGGTSGNGHAGGTNVGGGGGDSGNGTHGDNNNNSSTPGGAGSGGIGTTTVFGTFGGGGGAGGGGGGGIGGAGGAGGGAQGTGSGTGNAGTANTGGGGGGAGLPGSGGAGGSGIVIVQYAWVPSGFSAISLTGGNITLASGNSTLDALGSGGSITVNDPISGPGDLSIVSSVNAGGVVTLSGSNSYIGNTYISSGSTLVVGSANALNGTTEVLVNGAGSTLDLAGITPNGTPSLFFNAAGGSGSIGGLTNSGNTAVTYGGGVGLYANANIGGNNGDITLSGVVGFGGGGINKVGSDTLYLTGGTDGNYGSTTVSAGAVRVNFALGGSVSVAAGASNYGGGVLGGNGSVGAVTLSAGAVKQGGIIAAGPSNSDGAANSTVGVGTLTTDVETWNNGSVYLWKAGDGNAAVSNGISGTPGIDYDTLQIGTGTTNQLTIPSSGPAVTIDATGNLTGVAYGTTFGWAIAQVGVGNSTITAGNGTISPSSTTNLIGSSAFALDTSGLTINGSQLSAGNFALYFETVGSNNDLVLYAATPEPGTAMPVAFGAGPLLLRRRRRAAKDAGK